MSKNCRDLTDLSWERPESILYIFNTHMYVTSFANISILKVNFRKTHTVLLTLSISQAQVVRISWNFKKIYRIIFCSHTRPGRSASMFCFFTILLEEGGGEGFYYLRIQLLWLLRLPFLVEASICSPFFRVFLSFTIC